MQPGTSYTAFVETRHLARGDRREVARAIRELRESGDTRNVLVFDDADGVQTDVDPREAPDGREDAESKPPTRGPGRPRLGVVGREVTLLPRHWEWLAAQPGGASVALRKLVERARRENAGADRIRLSQEAAYRFMSALAGDERGFEEATRALFARDAHGFASHARSWSADVRDYATRLAKEALE